LPVEAGAALTLAATRRIVVATLRKLLGSGHVIGLKGPDGGIMAMAASDIERLIRARIPDAEVTIRDLAGDGDHYAATVIAESFRGKSRVQQHQIVYEALKGEMGGKLHALALQTGTPER
jgi:stress-induced morphogen